MNQTCRCTGRLRASIQLKCNFIFTIKKNLFFNQSGTFPSKVFQTRFDPNEIIKQSTKVPKSQSTLRLQKKRSSLIVFGQEQKTLMPYLSSSHSNIGLRRFRAYRPTSHTVPQYQTSHSRTIYTHFPPDPLSSGRRRLVSFLT